MKKVFSIFLLTILPFFSFSQSVGFGYSDPKEIIKIMNSWENKLLIECSKIMGLNLDSICISENKLDSIKVEKSSYNILFVSKSNKPVLDLDTKELKETIVSNYFVNPIFVKPVYRFFIIRENDTTQVIIQKYY